VKTL
jgi:hypothetical protein